jgi:hypothetical protein
MAHNGLVYFEGYQGELISFSAICKFAVPQLSTRPLAGDCILI